jgi:hypothetical protein
MARSSKLCATRLLSILTITLLLAGVVFAGDKKTATGPVLIGFTVSPPVRNMPPSAHHAGDLKEEKPLRHPGMKSRTIALPDPVAQTSTPTAAAASSLSQWEGLGYDFPNFTIVGVPPDTNMAVGPNHIVQWVNGGFAVFDKTGHTLYSVDDSTFWGNSTCNQLGGYSDPIVQYDKVADRWVVGEVAIPGFPGLIGQFAQCLAVSTTNDPAGSYNMWAYGFGNNVNDYPKIGLWPDAYYITWNIFNNSSGNFLYAEACGWNRADAIKGASAPGLVCFHFPVPTQTDTYASELPGDWDGSASPPANSPEYIMDVDTGTGELHLWKFHVDFANTNNSTLTGPTVLSGVAAFTSPCPTTQDCIAQPGTTQKVDALADRLMYRLAYRNFGDHESLVLNHSVTSTDSSFGTRIGVRWYEVRSPGGTPTINQEGTFAPDSDNRWMASVAQDNSGNIAVGYSISSAATYPSIRYTGRETGDPTGTLQTESTMIAGGGSQSSYNRWGDYSAMRIDPTDDCTFWYTTEYQKDNQPGNWYTRIGSFKFSSCGQTLTATTTTLASSKNPSNVGDNVTFTATVSPSAATGNVTFYDGATSLNTVALSGGSASLQTSSLSAGSHPIKAVYSGDSTYASSTSNTVTQTVNNPAPAATTTTVTGSPNPSTFGQSVTFTAHVTSSGGTPAGTVTFYDGATSLGSSALNATGVATLSTSTLSVGTHSNITAVYAGNANFAGSTSSPFTQTVNKANTSTTLTSNRNPTRARQTITFTATVNPSSVTGSVTFYDGATALRTVTLSSGRASFSTAFSSGTHSITAVYSGNANYNSSTSAVLSEVVR